MVSVMFVSHEVIAVAGRQRALVVVSIQRAVQREVAFVGVSGMSAVARVTVCRALRLPRRILVRRTINALAATAAAQNAPRRAPRPA